MLRGISSMATRQVLADLALAYRNRGDVEVESVGGVDAARRIEAGERFDFAVLADDAIERLAAAGRLDASTRVVAARCGMALAVRAGAERPDISSGRALREAVLAARSIGYSSGPSGKHLMALLERWHIADAVRPRLHAAMPGVPVAELIAQGAVEMGFQQMSELLNMPGIAIVGPLPDEIQAITVFSGAVCTSSTQKDEARAFLQFVASLDAAAAKRRHGMQE